MPSLGDKCQKMYDKHYSPFCDHRLLSFLSLVKYTPSLSKFQNVSSPYSTRLRLSSRVSLSTSQSLSLSPIFPSVWALILIRMEYHHTFFFQINFKRQILKKKKEKKKANTSCSLDFGASSLNLFLPQVQPYKVKVLAWRLVSDKKI